MLTNTWPFFVFRNLWPSGRFFYGVIFPLIPFRIIVPVLVAGVFAPDHVVVFIEWWEIAACSGPLLQNGDSACAPVFGTTRWKTRPLTAAQLREPYRRHSQRALHGGGASEENRRARIRPTWAPTAWPTMHKCLDRKPAERVKCPRSVCRSSRQTADLGVNTPSRIGPQQGTRRARSRCRAHSPRTLKMTPDQGPGHLGVQGPQVQVVSTHHQEGLATPGFALVDRRRR